MREILAGLTLILSFMGYSHKLRDDFGLNIGLIPLVLATTYIFILAIAARLSLMIFSIVATNALGVFFFLKSLGKKSLYRDFFPAYLVFFAFIIGLVIYLRGKVFFLYDDFSHWATISRLIIEKDAINTSFDTVIDFKSYPQATAYFIYGIVRFLGYAESNMMLAQGVLNLCLGFSIFTVLKTRVFDYLIGILSLVFILFYNVRPYGLLVDTVLATMAFGTLVFINEIDFKGKSRIFLVPILLSLVYVKNSGLIFAAFSLIFLAVKTFREDKRPTLIGVLTVITAHISWRNHVKNFLGSGGRHSISLESYMAGLKSNIGGIKDFTYKFIKNIGTDKIMWVLVLVLIGLFIYYKKDKKILSLLATIIGVYGIYQIGNYLMYITSMDAGELRRLACYDRYVRTIHIYLSLVAIYMLNKNFPDKKPIKIFSILILAFATFIIEDPEEIGLKDLSFREKIWYERDKQEVEPGKNILVKYEEMDNTRILTRAVMFDLKTSTVTDTYVGDEEKFDKNDYDYYLDLSD